MQSVKAALTWSEEALWLWGRLCDFERMGMLDIDPLTLFGLMTPNMRHECDGSHR